MRYDSVLFDFLNSGLVLLYGNMFDNIIFSA